MSFISLGSPPQSGSDARVVVKASRLVLGKILWRLKQAWSPGKRLGGREPWLPDQRPLQPRCRAVSRPWGPHTLARPVPWPDADGHRRDSVSAGHGRTAVGVKGTKRALTTSAAPCPRRAVPSGVLLGGGLCLST